MKKKKQANFLLRIFIIFVITVVSISVCWVGIFYETDDHEKNIIKAFSDSQYDNAVHLADIVQYHMEEYIKEGKYSTYEAEKKVSKDILMKETNSQNKYVFFYNTNHVVFERNEANTTSYGDKNIKEIFDFWEYNGGDNLNAAKKLISEGISSSAEIKKSNKTDMEIMSWSFFQVEGKKYLVGLCESENYLLEATAFNQHKIRMFAIGAAFTVVLIVLSSLFILNIFLYFRRIFKLESQLENKNMQTEELVSESITMKDAIKSASIKDAVTGVYNREFLYSVIRKMDNEVFLPIAVVTVTLRDIGSINDTLGYEKGEEILNDTVQIFKKNFTELDIISRTDDNEFVIIMVNTDEKGAAERTEKIIDDIKKSYVGIICNVALGISVKFKSEESLLNTLKASKMNISNFPVKGISNDIS